MIHEGSCHCGKIRYTVEGTIDQALECNCSICRRNGYLLWFVPRASVSLKTPEEVMSTYTFNRHVIKHHFCPTCGVSTFGMAKNKDGQDMVAVNIRCLPDLDLESVKRVPFDGASR
jgi:hypothetical protein